MNYQDKEHILGSVCRTKYMESWKRAERATFRSVQERWRHTSIKRKGGIFLLGFTFWKKCERALPCKLLLYLLFLFIVQSTSWLRTLRGRGWWWGCRWRWGAQAPASRSQTVAWRSGLDQRRWSHWQRSR